MKEVISITNLEQETDTFVNHPNLKMFNQKKKKTQQNTQYCYKDFSINVSSWALKPNVIHELQRSSIHQTWLWLWGLHLLVSTACITVIHTGTRCKPALGIYHRAFINNKMKMSYVFLLWFLLLLFFRLLQNKKCKKISMILLLKAIAGM